MNLERLVIVSHASTAAQSLAGVAALLGEGTDHNIRSGITGVLAINEGVFLQVLEGSKDALDALLARLAADTRHLDVRVVERRRIASRRFTGEPLVGPIVSSDLASVFARIERDADRAIDALAELIPAR